MDSEAGRQAGLAPHMWYCLSRNMRPSLSRRQRNTGKIFCTNSKGQLGASLPIKQGCEWLLPPVTNLAEECERKFLNCASSREGENNTWKRRQQGHKPPLSDGSWCPAIIGDDDQ